MKHLTPSPRYSAMKRLAASCLLAAALTSAVACEAVAQSRTTAAAAQPAPNTAATAAPTPAVQSELSLWELLEMLDWTFWPFVLVTGFGITLLTLRGLRDYQDNTRSKTLLAQQITTGSLHQFGSLVGAAPASRASRLFAHMIRTFNKTSRAEDLSDDSSNFLAEDRNSYETFVRVMAFLSDTSGALGLLGTVWGIFVTFYGGRLDGATILKGMGVALITTLVGLIISVMFNFGSTTLYAMYNARLGLISGKAEELRQALLAFQRGHGSRSRNGGSARPPAAQAEEFAGAAFPTREGANGHGY